MKQQRLNLPNELIIDNFAGGGGASTGIEAAFGRHVDIAINHDAVALAMHAANHPDTTHYCESVWDIDPIKVTGNQPVGLVWLSPDCKHFSKAKGGKPVEKKIRGLAWVGCKWAGKTKPRVIMLENVEEITSWTSLVAKRCPKTKRVVKLDGTVASKGEQVPLNQQHLIANSKRKGAHFKAFVGHLKTLGYKVEYRELRASNYGAPTIRKRLFLVARRDGLPICWPEPTHGAPESKGVQNGSLLPWRTAADCIDWSIPCPSIFERKKPLVEATLRRIGKGIRRYVLEAGEPFIVKCNHTAANYTAFRGQSINEPLQTITSSPGFAVVEPILTPFVVGIGGPAYSRKPTSIQKPIGTLPASGNYKAVAAAFLAPYYSDKKSTDARGTLPTEPVKTITTENRHALVTAFLAKHYTGVVGSDLRDPLATVTGVDHHSLVTASIVKFNTGAVGSAMNEPLRTVTAGGQQARPGTACTMGVLTSNLVKSDAVADENHFRHAESVRAFLLSYYGSETGSDGIDELLRNVTSRERFGLVTIKGQDYQIVDIGLRMLSPRELFHAQGFPADYIIGDDESQGLSLPKYAQVRMCGNSVPPDLSEALVRANFKHEHKIHGHIAA